MAEIVCFGEMLLRLTAPAGELLLQSDRMSAHFGGAEANVAACVARLGRTSAFVSALPDTALGRAARDALRAHGVDLAHVHMADEGRLGLYFLTPGAARRAPEVLYDRADSVFARMAPESVDWNAALAGARWLHLSGITPALGSAAAAAAQRAVREAQRLGVAVSFDGNYRSKLWAAWGGDGPAILRDLFAHARILFADERDIALVLGAQFDAADVIARRRAAAAAAFAAFPHVQMIAATTRVTHAVDRHDLGAALFTRTGEHVLAPLALEGVVERVGGGDAFAGGFLYALLEGMSEIDALRFALACGVFKHGQKGDMCLAAAEDIRALMNNEGLDVRR